MNILISNDRKAKCWLAMFGSNVLDIPVNVPIPLPYSNAAEFHAVKSMLSERFPGATIRVLPNAS